MVEPLGTDLEAFEALKYLVFLGFEERDDYLHIHTLGWRSEFKWGLNVFNEKMAVYGWPQRECKKHPGGGYVFDADAELSIRLELYMWDSMRSHPVGARIARRTTSFSDGWQKRVKKSLAVLEEIAECKLETTPLCPICGDMMVQRTMNKYKHPHQGEKFWGCWRYPDCRGMRAPWKSVVVTDPEVGKRLEHVRCPKCKMSMVIRMAMRGPNAGKKFLGCSEYPNCKETMGLFDGTAAALME